MAILDTGLADRIRAKGVRVVEVAGWKDRSAGSYSPQGAVHHHTAGSTSGATPSLATVIYGRPDVPGPLAQVLQSREPDGRDIAYVIAAGRSNNAGAGGWRGLAGNSSVGGLEVEHTGTGTVPPGRHEISARILAALVEAPGSRRDARLVCQHFEWAPTRKIDFRDLAPYDPAWVRARVAYWIGRTAEEDDMLDAADKDWLRQLAADRKSEIVRAAQEAALRTAHFLATGNENALFAGQLPDDLHEWIRDPDTVTLPRLLAAVRTADVDVPVAEIVQQILAELTPAAIAAAIPAAQAQDVAAELGARLARPLAN